MSEFGDTIQKNECSGPVMVHDVSGQEAALVLLFVSDLRIEMCALEHILYVDMLPVSTRVGLAVAALLETGL